MKKFLIIFLILSTFVFPQEKMANVQSELKGEKIIITYDFPKSTKGNIYDVSITCSIDGNPRMVIESVTSDVGAKIKSGKKKKIVWDVLKDVNEIGSAEFFVTATLTQENKSSLMGRMAIGKEFRKKHPKLTKIGMYSCCTILIAIILDY